MSLVSLLTPSFDVILHKEFDFKRLKPWKPKPGTQFKLLIIKLWTEGVPSSSSSCILAVQTFKRISGLQSTVTLHSFARAWKWKFVLKGRKR